MNVCIKGFRISALICLLSIVGQGAALASTSLTHASLWTSLAENTVAQGEHNASVLKQTYNQNPDMPGKGRPRTTDATGGRGY
ncbi:MAG TPA: hypothetical protein V6D10_03850 [Trichocoleus sp.]